MTFCCYCYSFHALKDEAFIRHSLQRQAAALHHATVGYTVSYHDNSVFPLHIIVIVRYKELIVRAMKKEHILIFLSQNRWLVT